MANPNREINYIIKADNSQAMKAVDDLLKKTTLADSLRKGGDIGELTPIKKFGKNVGEFMESNNSLVRGVGIAGGVLAAVNIAGKVAEAWQAANAKVEEGKIKASEWVAELGKGLPILGGIIKGAESFLASVTGITKAQREANREAEKWDAIISSRNKERDRGRDAIDSAIAGTGRLNETDRDRIIRESNDRLGKIRDARKIGKDTISLDDGRAAKLDQAEADVIRRREADLAKVEQDERDRRAQHQDDVESRIAEARKDVEDERFRTRIESLREQGKAEEAAIMQIEHNKAERIAELDRERVKLQKERGLTDPERIALNDSIDARKQAVNESSRAAIEAAKRDAQRQREEDAAKAAAEELRGVKGLDAIVRVGRERVGAQDARFASGLYQQQHKLEVEQAKTAKDMLAEMKTLNDRLRVVRLN